jgi:hypothetical protein
VEQLGKAYQLVGKLHVPLGDMVHVEGVVVEGPFKGYEGGPNLRVQRIQGSATQQDIQIRIRPYFTAWGKKAYGEGRSLPDLEMGKTYRMEGYETGGYIGHPAEVYRKAGLAFQTTGYYFQTELVVYKAKAIEPLDFTPADFPGRRALMQGTACTRDNQSVMEGNGWNVRVVPEAAWPEHVEGKLIETDGFYNSFHTNLHAPDVKQKQFALADGTWKLVRLEDQLGRTVALRGSARSLNDVWWFNYRGTDIYVENLAQLPGWTADNHWRPMVIRGTLDKARLPRLDQVTVKVDRDLKDYYIVRKASWEPLPELLGVERPIEKEHPRTQPIERSPQGKSEGSDDPFE